MAQRPNVGDGWVAIGRVRRTHGVRGELCVEPYAADMHRYDSLRRLFIAGRPYAVRSARPQGDVVLVSLEGVDSREAADALRNVEIAVPAAERAPLPPERFYLDDLLGLRVIDGAGRVRGTVVEVLERPAADVLRLELTGGGEGMVPLVRAIVQRVDLRSREVHIDPPEGLLPDPAPGPQAP